MMALINSQVLDSQPHWNDDRPTSNGNTPLHPAPRYWFGNWSDQLRSTVLDHLREARVVAWGDDLVIKTGIALFPSPRMYSVARAVETSSHNALPLIKPKSTIFLYPAWYAADYNTQRQQLIAAIMELARTTTPNLCSGPCDNLQAVEQALAAGTSLGSKATWAYVGFIIHRQVARGNCLFARDPSLVLPVPPCAERSVLLELGLGLPNVQVSHPDAEAAVTYAYAVITAASDALSAIKKVRYQEDQQAHWNDDRSVQGEGVGHASPQYWFGSWSEEKMEKVSDQLDKATILLGKWGIAINTFYANLSNPAAYYEVSGNPKVDAYWSKGITLYGPWLAADRDTQRHQLIAAIMELTGTNNGCRAGKTCHNIQDVQDLSVRNDLDSTWAYVGFIVQRYAARGTCTLADSPPRRPGNTEAHATDCLYPYRFPSPGHWDPTVNSCQDGNEWGQVNNAYWLAFRWLHTALRYVNYALEASPEIARQMWTWGYARKADENWDDYFNPNEISLQYWFGEDFWYDHWETQSSGSRVGWQLLKEGLQSTYAKYMQSEFRVTCRQRTCDNYSAWSVPPPLPPGINLCNQVFAEDTPELARIFLHETMHWGTGLSDNFGTGICQDDAQGRCYSSSDCRRLAIHASRHLWSSNDFFFNDRAFLNIENYTYWISKRWKTQEFCLFPPGWTMP